MWKKAVFFLVAVVIVVTSVIVTAVILTKPKPIGGTDVQLNTKYYMKWMNTSIYQYQLPNGMPSGEVIRLQQNDASYCVFSDNWKVFRIHFAHEIQSKPTTFTFIVTNLKRGNGGLSATIKHIYDGKIITYEISATKDRINLISPVDFNVNVASELTAESDKIEIRRVKTEVMSFARTTPSYIPESAK